MISDYGKYETTLNKPHLGGHYEFTSMFMEELDFLKHKLNIKSMLDIGCGLGGMVEFANFIDIYSVGVDGDPTLQEKPYVIKHDFNDGELKLDDKFDLVYSIEFLEHVYEVYQPNYMPLFQKGNYVFVSGATPGQGGWHHVNEQHREYWVDKFKQYNFTYRQDIVDEIINVSKNKDFMMKNMMFFENNNFHTNTTNKTPLVIENIDDILLKSINDFVNRGGQV